MTIMNDGNDGYLTDSQLVQSGGVMHLSTMMLRIYTGYMEPSRPRNPTSEHGSVGLFSFIVL